LVPWGINHYQQGIALTSIDIDKKYFKQLKKGEWKRANHFSVTCLCE
jgi:hypothetical protein